MYPKWVEGMLETAKTIVRDGGVVNPVCFIVDAQKMAINVVMMDAKESEKIAQALRTVIKQQNPDEYLFVMDTYFKDFDLKENTLLPLVLSGALKVAQLPDAKECIMAIYGDRKQEKLGVISYKRVEKDVVFEELRWLGEDFAGRFAKLREV